MKMPKAKPTVLATMEPVYCRVNLDAWVIAMVRGKRCVVKLCLPNRSSPEYIIVPLSDVVPETAGTLPEVED